MEKVENNTKKEMERIGRGKERFQYFIKLDNNRYEFLGYVFTKQGHIYNNKGQEMHCLDHKGSLYIVLSPRGIKRKRMNAARLMYEIFSGTEIKRGNMIGFKDGDYHNIAFNNLYECKTKRAGRKNSPTLFNEEEERMIRDEYLSSGRCKNQFDKGNSVSYRDLAKKYHCAVHTIQCIVAKGQDMYA